MKLALRLVAQGNSVSWVSPEGDFSPRDIRTSVTGLKEPHVIAIDDADIYGSELTPMVRELARTEPFPLVLLAIRSGRVDRVINTALLVDVPLEATLDSDARRLGHR